MSETKITRVKRSEKSISISYQRENKDGNVDKFTLLCHESPNLNFHEAFNKLNDEVKVILGLPDKFCGADMYINQITLKWVDNRVSDLQIHFQKKIESAEALFCAPTPKLSEPEEGKENKKKGLPSSTLLKIQDIFQQALKYIDGDRAQMTLDFQEKQEDEHDTRIDALDIIMTTGRATIASLTRRLKITSEEATKLMADFEEAGIVGPLNGNNARDIMISDKAEGIEKLNMVAA